MHIKYVFVFIFSFSWVPISWSIKCYTCEENSLEDLKFSCKNFTSSAKEFSKNCETGQKSCRLIRRVVDNVIINRDCENNKINDCITANGIEYFYCTKDLCNLMSPSEDNEDELEEETGSGINEEENSTEKTSTINTTSAKILKKSFQEINQTNHFSGTSTCFYPSNLFITIFSIINFLIL